MTNPYSLQPNRSFWKRAISESASADELLTQTSKFGISPDHKIAMAGSCFARHLSRAIQNFKYSFFNVEPFNTEQIYSLEESTLFSARFGNIYTSRQLLQLFQRAFGFFEPEDNTWVLRDGRYVDPFRPRIPINGFISQSELLKQSDLHLQAVQQMFLECDVFIYTLGLTEAWVSRTDGALVPLPPGAVGAVGKDDNYQFYNLTVDDVRHDLTTFLDLLVRINPSIKVILTVSPVPISATFTENHVYSASIYSKAVLRVAAESIQQSYECVDYFPSYDLVNSPSQDTSVFIDQSRQIAPHIIEQVIQGFSLRYLANSSRSPQLPSKSATKVERVADMSELLQTIKEYEEAPCDDELLLRLS